MTLLWAVTWPVPAHWNPSEDIPCSWGARASSSVGKTLQCVREITGLWGKFSAISRGLGGKSASQSTKYDHWIEKRRTREWAKAWQRWQPGKLHNDHCCHAEQSLVHSTYDFHYLESQNTSDLMNKKPVLADFFLKKKGAAKEKQWAHAFWPCLFLAWFPMATRLVIMLCVCMCMCVYVCVQENDRKWLPGCPVTWMHCQFVVRPDTRIQVAMIIQFP